LIPAELVRPYDFLPERPALRLNVVGPTCNDEMHVPTHDLNWSIEDFSPRGNIGLFRRVHGPLLRETHDFIAVQFPEGTILHSWEVGFRGRLINGGSGVCLGSGLLDNERVTSTCWDVRTGSKIRDVPANGGFPMMPAANSPTVVVSDLQWHDHIITDGGWQTVRRRVIWDSSTGKEIGSWTPDTQSYHDGWVHRLREEAFPCALSP